MLAEVTLSLSRAPMASDFAEIIAVVAYVGLENTPLSVQSIPGDPCVKLEFAIRDSKQEPAAKKLGRAFLNAVSSCSKINIKFQDKNAIPSSAQNVPTERQSQYLAYIATYTQLNKRAPSEAEMQRYFKSTPPTVHQMVLKLEEKGFITRIPHQARSLKVIYQPISTLR